MYPVHASGPCPLTTQTHTTHTIHTIHTQAPAIWYANQLRWWVGEERGQDLFAYCRLPQSCVVCIMASFLFALIFGVVIAAIPA